MEDLKLWIDTETGGLNPEKHSLLTISLVVQKNGIAIDALDLGIKHKDFVVTAEAMTINKIQLENLSEKPEIVIGKIAYFVKKHFKEPAILHGQNTIFDINFLKQFFINNNCEHIYHELFSHRYFDLMSLSLFLKDVGKIKCKNVSLDTLRDYFGVNKEKENIHNSLVDTLDTIEVYNKYKDIIGGKIC